MTCAYFNGIGVKPFTEANHPPVVRIAGDRERNVKAGEGVTLDASGTTDPDGDEMVFAWTVYPTTTEATVKVVIEGRDTRAARLVVAPELAGRTIPILLTVTDRGRPRLTRYGRVLITVVRQH